MATERTFENMLNEKVVTKKKKKPIKSIQDLKDLAKEMKKNPKGY